MTNFIEDLELLGSLIQEWRKALARLDIEDADRWQKGFDSQIHRVFGVPDISTYRERADCTDCGIALLWFDRPSRCNQCHHKVAS